MKLTDNVHILKWVDEMAALTKPEKIVWIDGSEEQLEQLRAEAMGTGELIKLNEEKLPVAYLHRSDVNDVARVEDRTFICSKRQEDAGPTNNWMEPQEMYKKLYEIFDGSMKGRTMYVIPYSMGVIGSDFAKYGIELTDSIYVVVSMAIMTRIGTKALDAIGDSDDLYQGSAFQGSARPREEIHRPLPGGQHHHVRQLRLRRKRSARQKVLCTAHSLHPRQERGMDGRAYAHPRR